MKQLLVKNKKGFIIYILGALLTAVVGILQPLGISIGFSILEAPTTRDVVIRAVLTIVLGLSPVFLQVLSRYMRIGFMRDVLIDVRVLAYEKMMKIPIEFFRQKRSDDYVANLVNDINTFEQDFFLSILNMFYSYGVFILGIILIFILSPIIGFGIFISSLLIYLISKLYEKPMRTNIKKTQEGHANYNDQVANILNGLEVIKLYQVEDRFRSPFYEIVERLERIKRKTNLLQTSQFSILNWTASTIQVGLLILATIQYMNGSLTLTGLIIIFNFSGQLIWSHINATSMINRYKGSLDIFERITSQPSWDYGQNEFKFEQAISVKDLNFKYGENQVLNNLNFTIHKGDKVLIYGPSGTGKTTLLNCLAQNLTSYDGQIMIDDQELKSIDFESMMDQCGYVRQSHFLFEGSILDNIVLNQPVDKKRVIAILESLDLWTWISSLEDGLDHQLISNGSNISGGQRQRLSIARELYRDCGVLFVDEPSASLDDESAKVLYDTLFGLDKTMVIVSHRHLGYLQERSDFTLAMNTEGVTYYEKA